MNSLKESGLTLQSTDEELSSYIDMRWGQVGSDLMMGCQDTANALAGLEADVDADCGDCYGDGVEAYKEFIQQEFFDMFGSKDYIDHIAGRVEKLLADFNG